MRGVSDARLLDTCALAGPPGSPSHRRAALLYGRACGEWRRRDQAIRQAEAERIVFLVLHATARQVWAALMKERTWREAA